MNLESIIGRIAERKIQEAIEEGQFDNLPGKGKPIVFDDDPATPPELRMANKVLKNAGVLPEWIQVQKDIQSEREEIAAMRGRLLKDNETWRKKVAALPESHSTAKLYAEWHAKSRAAYLQRLKSVNTFILKFSLLAPSSQVAPTPYKIEAEMEALDAVFLPPDQPIAVAVSPESDSTRTGLKGIARARYQGNAEEPSDKK